MDQQLANELFEYRNGKLFNKTNRGSRAGVGKESGVYQKGYLRSQVKKKQYFNHRLIFLMHYGYMPEMIDHINGIRDDNRIENLRPVNYAQNRWNASKPSHNKSGVKGIRWREKQKKWVVAISCNKHRKQYGSFFDLEEAKLFLDQIRKQLHGEFSNYG